MAEKKVIYYRESFWQSVLADITTFGFLIFSIWFSSGDKAWTFVCVLFLALFIMGKSFGKSRTFTSMSDLKKHIEREGE